MKKALLILLAIILVHAGQARNLSLQETDTIIVKFGNNSQLIIYVDNESDLKALEDYDINAMIKELNMNITSSEDEVGYLTITDESGTKYLKDTIVAIDKTVAKSKPFDFDFSFNGKDDDEDEGDWDDDWDDRWNGKSRGTRHDINFEIGMNNWLEDGKFPDQNNQLYAIKPWGSWYVAINSVHRTSLGTNFALHWGGGISWYNWKMENRSVRITKTDTEVDFSEDPILKGTKSKLAATYLNVNLVPTINFSSGHKDSKKSRNGFKRRRNRGNGARIGLGGYAGYRIDSWTKFVYEDSDGDKEKEKEGGNFFINNFRYGVRGEFGFNDVDFFVNYDLNTVFSAGRGPKLHAISFGIII